MTEKKARRKAAAAAAAAATSGSTAGHTSRSTVKPATTSDAQLAEIFGSKLPESVALGRYVDSAVAVDGLQQAVSSDLTAMIEDDLEVELAVQQADRELARILNAGQYNQPPTKPVEPAEQLARLHERYLDLVREMKRSEQQRERERAQLSDIDFARSVLFGGSALPEPPTRKEGKRRGSKEPYLDVERPSSVETEIVELRGLLHGLRAQYEAREKHIRLVLRSRDLEYQVCNRKQREAQTRADDAAIRCAELHGQIQKMRRMEQELQGQIEAYTDKYHQVEEALSQSNELFHNFRNDQDMTVKKIKRLEKDNVQTRSKADTLNRKVLEMMEECKRLQDQIGQTEKKRAKLEDLCRALRRQQQAEGGGGGAAVGGGEEDAGGLVVIDDGVKARIVPASSLARSGSPALGVQLTARQQVAQAIVNKSPAAKRATNGVA